MNGRLKLAVWMFLGLALLGAPIAAADEPKSPPDKKPAKQKPTSVKSDNDFKPLNKAGTVLLDLKGKRLRMKSKVVLREGVLEMFLCRKQTKEHESVLSADIKAFEIHAGLLALGAKSGRPVQFVPKYKPVTGQRIDIFVQWADKKGKPHRVRAQEWVRHAIRRYYAEPMKKLPTGFVMPKDSELRFDDKNGELVWYGPMSDAVRDVHLKLSKNAVYQKAIKSFHKRSQPRQMKANWVFGGSGFYVDEKTGERFYQAEGGDVICVANFPTATIDVSIESSASGEENLLFEAYSERIPPLGTEVTIELVPVFEKNKKPAAEKTKR